MKKLFSLASVFLLILVMAGCTNDTTEITDLQAKIEQLEIDIAGLEENYESSSLEVSALQTIIEDLNNQIADLQAEIYDNVITFTLTDEYGTFSSKTAGYDDDFTGNLFDLLDDNFTVGYTDSEWGKFIYSLDHLSPKTGAFISFSRNSEPSMVGVEASLFEDEDVFSFEVMWWDMTQKAVDDAIQLFLLNYASEYVNDEVLDYNVISALSLLGLADDYVTVTEVEALVNAATLTTTNDYFKAIIQLQSVGANSDTLITDLNTIVAVGPYGQTAYGLLALDSNPHTVDYSAFVTAALTDLNTITPYDLGLDAGGISLVALSNYTSETGVDTLISEYSTWISTSQLDTGGVKTRDVVWGETTYPGTENAASMSQVILGLIANDINPTSTEYTKSDNNLITRLLDYQTDTGSFDWVLGDEFDEDLAFSTPQAFLALVTYQIYANTYEAVNPYDFN
ncbi:MAG: peptidase [Candidatus Izimaplasma sp.]|nr:peptidase [Candidatus Izimaplasma bacterium]